MVFSFYHSSNCVPNPGLERVSTKNQNKMKYIETKNHLFVLSIRGNDGKKYLVRVGYVLKTMV